MKLEVARKPSKLKGAVQAFGREKSSAGYSMGNLTLRYHPPAGQDVPMVQVRHKGYGINQPLSTRL